MSVLRLSRLVVALVLAASAVGAGASAVLAVSRSYAWASGNWTASGGVAGSSGALAMGAGSAVSGSVTVTGSSIYFSAVLEVVCAGGVESHASGTGTYSAGSGLPLVLSLSTACAAGGSDASLRVRLTDGQTSGILAFDGSVAYDDGVAATAPPVPPAAAVVISSVTGGALDEVRLLTFVSGLGFFVLSLLLGAVVVTVGLRR